MKLYYVPGACSLAPHIVMRELGMKFDLEKVSGGKTDKGNDFNKVNPNSYVPVLELDNGEKLTEAQVVLQYLADQKPEANLLPKFGTMDRYRVLELLNYEATELHKRFGVLFDKSVPENAREASIKKIASRLDHLQNMLGEKEFLRGNTFTVADAYGFVILSWLGYMGMDLKKWPTLAKYVERISQRPSVKAALEAEKS